MAAPWAPKGHSFQGKESLFLISQLRIPCRENQIRLCLTTQELVHQLWSGKEEEMNTLGQPPIIRKRIKVYLISWIILQLLKLNF